MSSIGNWVDAATADSEQALVDKVADIALKTSSSSARSIHTVTSGAGSPSSPAGPQTPNYGGGGGGDASSVASSDDSHEVISAAERSLIQKVLRRGLLDTKANMSVKQKDPNSILYSTKSFKELNLRPELLQGVYAMGFNAPSRIQEVALPLLLKDPPQNLIAQSQSGTGKTAAFVLAMISRVDVTQNYPQVLCLSPTYELAIQTGEIIKQMSKFCPDITIQFAVRGIEDPVSRGYKITSHIVIGTPGKMTDWAFRTCILDLSTIRVFVLDEADVMIATQGYQDSSIKIHRKLPRNCQMMLFSATYESEVMEFAEKIIPDATIFRLSRDEESLDNIKQYYIMCKNQDEKYDAIANIYGVITIGQAMIFCHTRRTAAWLSAKLVQDGHAVALLSGELTVEQRLHVLTRFRDGKEKILITTNVMARGIDIDQVTLVVNFDIPLDINHKADCETYLHRIGRTGRFGKSGIAINLIDSQSSMRNMQDIEAHFGRPIQKLNHENVVELEELEK